LNLTVARRRPAKQAVASLTQRIYESMLRDIITGEIGQGEFLSEVRLAEEFQASRTPVREACIHLYKEGLLRVAPHKGYVVTEISLDEIGDLYQLRQILEPEAAALAASNQLRPDDIGKMQALLDVQKSLVSRGRTYESYLQLSGLEYSFHYGIAKGSGNDKLAKFMSEIMNHFRRFYYVVFRRSPWLDVNCEEHREILEALKARDASNARHLMSEHVKKGAERGIQLFLGTYSQ
jgi:GntR family transcriptional regulator, rspAB operon transcriptional repressor